MVDESEKYGRVEQEEGDIIDGQDGRAEQEGGVSSGVPEKIYELVGPDARKLQAHQAILTFPSSSRPIDELAQGGVIFHNQATRLLAEKVAEVYDINSTSKNLFDVRQRLAGSHEALKRLLGQNEVELADLNTVLEDVNIPLVQLLNFSAEQERLVEEGKIEGWQARICAEICREMDWFVNRGIKKVEEGLGIRSLEEVLATITRWSIRRPELFQPMSHAQYDLERAGGREERIRLPIMLRHLVPGAGSGNELKDLRKSRVRPFEGMGINDPHLEPEWRDLELRQMWEMVAYQDRLFASFMGILEHALKPEYLSGESRVVRREPELEGARAGVSDGERGFVRELVEIIAQAICGRYYRTKSSRQRLRLSQVGNIHEVLKGADDLQSFFKWEWLKQNKVPWACVFAGGDSFRTISDEVRDALSQYLREPRDFLSRYFRPEFLKGKMESWQLIDTVSDGVLLGSFQNMGGLLPEMPIWNSAHEFKALSHLKNSQEYLDAVKNIMKRMAPFGIFVGNGAIQSYTFTDRFPMLLELVREMPDVSVFGVIEGEERFSEMKSVWCQYGPEGYGRFSEGQVKPFLRPGLQIASLDSAALQREDLWIRQAFLTKWTEMEPKQKLVLGENPELFRHAVNRVLEELYKEPEFVRRQMRGEKAWDHEGLREKLEKPIAMVPGWLTPVPEGMKDNQVPEFLPDMQKEFPPLEIICRVRKTIDRLVRDNPGFLPRGSFRRPILGVRPSKPFLSEGVERVSCCRVGFMKKGVIRKPVISRAGEVRIIIGDTGIGKDAVAQEIDTLGKKKKKKEKEEQVGLPGGLPKRV